MDRSTLRMITLLARKSQMYIGAAFKHKYNISVAEQPFFMALQKCEGATQEELTEMVCVDKAVTTRVVKTLEEKGFLIREKDMKDRRQNRIYPTPMTRKLETAVQKELLTFNDAVTRGISKEELEIVQKALAKMEANLAALLSGKNAKNEILSTEVKGDTNDDE